MTPRAYQQVDVFTRIPYLGNALGVVMDGTRPQRRRDAGFRPLDQPERDHFFAAPSPAAAAQGADYRVRIFTPGDELPFAGHPTLGSCHAWLQAAARPKAAGTIVQECAKAWSKLERDGTRLAFAAPSLQRSTPDAALIAPCGCRPGPAHRADPRSAVAGQRAGSGWAAARQHGHRAATCARTHAALGGLARGIVGVAGMDSCASSS